ncbi:S66 peptidase family protein [Altibacter sp. HG106]|uniref:S66 peptidase family protein n=1 Tax=Altibacter sp. HG106 TaxID=3023937 RepID=UPI002350FC34|nr:LD-carboxypeptidase [Altibacter sp. HG106]MDC7994822.1 LD-carboxypeptidase [Altibacter sp. HG106]
MITPPFLKKGDAVGIVSTARKISSARLVPFLDLLESWGLQPVLGKTINAEDHQYAGSDTLRRKDLQQMLDTHEIKAIWCAKGGYGTVRIIDGINFEAFRRNPKWIIGYSDATVLHSHVHNFAIETLHAQMGEYMENKSEASRQTAKTVLFGDPYRLQFENTDAKSAQNASAVGQLVGGNLSILYSLCGSDSAINTEGKILFIEDLDEYLYHIDRMMQNLKRNRMFDGIQALLVGGMTKMHDNRVPFGKTAKEIVLDTVKEYDFPVIFDVPAGHVDDNRALILGRQATLTVTPSLVTVEF